MARRQVGIKVALLLGCCMIVHHSQHVAQAQDILRQRQQNQNQNTNNPLANIQLPPQLASLTPQQLHQLAQLRELQLQQQAAQQQQSSGNNQDSVAPAPIGADLLPTSQPVTTEQAKSTQSSSQSSQNTDTNDRHDDGAYNESGTEMEGVTQAEDGGPSSAAASSGASASQTGGGGSSAQAAPTFEVNWNKCPQLEPSESEKSKKTQVITKCLQSAPIPTNLTRENVEMHREQIATCALKVEGWFDESGNYKYSKAESEIRGKKLEPAIELQVLKFHVACKDEASKKFPRDQNKLIDQVQFYQACMDYYISIVCEIEVSVDQ